MKEGMTGFRFKSRREANSIHAGTVDYAQGMHARTRGGPHARGSADWQGRHGGTFLLLAWMGGFRNSDAGGHVHGDALQISDGTSSSLAAGQIRLEQLEGTHVEAQTSHLNSTSPAVLGPNRRCWKCKRLFSLFHNTPHILFYSDQGLSTKSSSNDVIDTSQSRGHCWIR